MSYIGFSFSPVLIVFGVILLGYALETIRIYNISLGKVWVMFIAFLLGYLISSNRIAISSVTDEQLIGTMKSISSLGTALFSSAIGLEAGLSIMTNAKKHVVESMLCGTIIVGIGFVCAMVIQKMDSSVSHSVLMGIVAGALTSTPGMAAAMEILSVLFL